MNLEEIRTFKHRAPFEIFEVVLIDGRAFEVRHPDFILIPPKGTWVYIADPTGHVEHINTLVIGSIRLVKTKPKGRRRKAG